MLCKFQFIFNKILIFDEVLLQCYVFTSFKDVYKRCVHIFTKIKYILYLLFFRFGTFDID